MNDSSRLSNEKIINSKKRIQNHGEVFTPKRIVKKIVDMPHIREASENLTSTFLEPAAGEGVFLVEVLNRKLNMIQEKYNEDLRQYENYSLLALSTLYGVELLEDNTQKCAMNMYQVYYEIYQQQAVNHGKKMKNKVLDSAKLIISINIAQGNFLTRLTANEKPIVFSEWKPLNLCINTKIIKIQRTEYAIEEILSGVKKENGESSTYSKGVEQLDLFDIFDDEEITESKENNFRYVPVNIIDVYKEKMEEFNG